MLVIGIMSILTSLAIAAYFDYTKRTRMVEVMVAAGSCRNPVFEAYYFGRQPDPGEWGCETGSEPWSELVQSISVDPNGKIIVVAQGFGDDDIDGKVLTLTPLVDGELADIATDKGKSLGWRCGDPADGTTIHPNFVPSSCRGQ